MLDSTILRESGLPLSVQNGSQGRGSSRSSILQTWRVLENEFFANRAHETVVGRLQNGSSDWPGTGIAMSTLPWDHESHNSLSLEGSTENENMTQTVGEDAMTSQTEQEDHRSMTLEQSQDLGEAERERVREIFREWMNTGGNGLTSHDHNMNGGRRAELLSQSEIERVRFVREWIQMGCKWRGNSGANHEELVAGIGSQIEWVHEGLVLDNNGVQTNNRRGIRRLWGRQALVDLLESNKQERERELQVLLDHCPVQNFAFRNKIQSLLRIRLLHNRGSGENHRTDTAAESELGLLRQQHTVSGLREGFLSRLQNNVHVQANHHSSSLPNGDTHMFRENKIQANSSVEIVDNEHERVEPVNEDRNSGPSSNCAESLICGSETNSQGSASRLEASQVHHVVDCDSLVVASDEVSGTASSEDNAIGIWQVISTESSQHSAGEQVQLEETNEANSNPVNEEFPLDGLLPNSETVELPRTDGPEDSSDRHQPIAFQDISTLENAEHGQREETEVIPELYLHTNGQHETRDILPHSVDLEDPGSDDAHAWDSTTQGVEQIAEDEEQEWASGSSSNEWRAGTQQELDQEEWEDSARDANTEENEDGEQSQLEGSFWRENGFQQTLGNWSALPSEAELSLTGRVDMHYYSDDDSAHNIELRELLTRSRVSSLLRSGFRESLGQLIQSYVERQSHTPHDWEVHEMAPPDEDSSDVDGHSDVFQSSLAPHGNWEQQFYDIHWSRDMHWRPGKELVMINDLRIEMARLQQRLNHMQGILESCVDIQLELQRSIRQEVSAALNRSTISAESDEAMTSISGLKWNCARQGICCICCESKIDSLLYRCGHMCTCAECAAVLLVGQGKCPICQAPVVEVIRAYTIQ